MLRVGKIVTAFALIASWLPACSRDAAGDRTPAPSAQHASARAQATEPTPRAAARPTGAPEAGLAWDAAVFAMRAGMRPELAEDAWPSSPDVARTLVTATGGRLDCSFNDIAWASEEAGVLHASCDGRLPIAGRYSPVRLTFERYELPGVPETPGLLSIRIESPGDAAEAWLSEVEDAVQRRLGPGRIVQPEQRWHVENRYVLLHDARKAPCGGICPSYLWLAGPKHPGLGPRGF